MTRERVGQRSPLERRSVPSGAVRLLVAAAMAASLALQPGLALGGANPGPLAANGASGPASAAGPAWVQVSTAAGSTTAAATTAAATTAPAATTDAAVPGADLGATWDANAAPDEPPAGPSEMAIEAAAHAGDRIAFAPGSAVTMPFVPRADDPWAVDGGLPRQLPAGAASGFAMLATRQGADWAPGSRAPEAGAGPFAAAPTILTSDPLAASAASARRQVFGFLPYWELTDSSTTLDYDVLSTIAYFGVGVDASGNLLKKNPDGTTSVGWAGWASSRLTGVIQDAHHRGVRVVLTVEAFAWTSGQAKVQSTLLASSTARGRLAKQVAAAVRDRGADGVNLDFEPIASGRSADFVAFVRTLRHELDAIATGYQVTFDTTGSIGSYPLENALASGGADAVFVMGYDYRTATSPTAGAVSPLTGPAYDLTDTAEAYLARVPASKVIMGVPYYGRAWSTVSDAANARTQTGVKFGASASVTYGTAVDLAAKYGRRYDTREQVAWFAYQMKSCAAAYGCQTTWREVYYDDAQSLRAKFDMINGFGLRGVGIWALGYDGSRPELTKALSDKFVRDTTAPEAGIQVLPIVQGDEGFPVAWTATDLSGIASYDVQVSADRGPWTDWLHGTTAAGGTWLGRDGHAYAFRVRATDAKGNVGAWDAVSLPDPKPALRVGGFAVVKVAANMRSRASTSAAVLTKLAVGKVVALTGGPVSAGGYTWYQVSGPLQSWPPASPVRTGWVAAKGKGTTWLAARTAPNTTAVDAGIIGLSFGTGGPASLGTGQAALVSRAFSPGAMGPQGRLTLHWANGLALKALTMKVFRANGSLLGSRTVTGLTKGAHSWAWDGKLAGKVLPDGGYVLQLVGTVGSTTYRAPSARPTDPAQVAAYGVTIDRSVPTLSGASVSASLFSPNGDGRLDTIAVTASGVGASRWRLTVAPLGSGGPGGPGAPVRTLSGIGAAPRLTWDGRDDGGAVVADRRYRLTLTLLDDAGNLVSRAFDVISDTTAPTASPTATAPAVSPDGDGAVEATRVAWTASEPSTAVARVYHGSTLVRTLTIAPAGGTTPRGSGTATWNGRDTAGHAVADGTYAVRLELTDAAGNRATLPVALVVDRTAGWLRWSPASFYPQDGDALAKTGRLTFRLTRTATSSLQVVGVNGTVVRTAWTNRKQAAGTISWTWDGRTGAKAFVAPGTYTAVLTARSGLGTTTLRRAIVVDAFSVGSLPASVSAGQTLTITFSAVEPLSTRPVVSIILGGRTVVSASAKLISTGHYTVRLTVPSGLSGAATLRISARDTGGRVNASVRSLALR